MVRDHVHELPFEFVLNEQGVSEKDIEWVLSKLDSQEYLLADCHYLARSLKIRLRRF